MVERSGRGNGQLRRISRQSARFVCGAVLCCELWRGFSVALLLPLLLLLLPVFVSPTPAGVVGVGVRGRLLEYGCPKISNSWRSAVVKRRWLGRPCVRFAERRCCRTGSDLVGLLAGTVGPRHAQHTSLSCLPSPN